MHAAQAEHVPTSAAPPADGGLLRQALADEQLRLLYQPLVDLQSGAVVSLEALLRWQHPQRGLLTAGEFLPQANGLTAELGDWVLRRACRDLHGWRLGGQVALKVAINVAPSQFCDLGYGDSVAAMLDEYGIESSALSLEITETALTSAGERCDTVLSGFKLRGLHLTLDDFGTGHASLSNLKRYPFDAIKIDSAFVRDVAADSHDAAICKSIIAMGHHLGMKVVAEGVESEAQCDFLRRNMCDQIQGYFFAAPMAPAALQEWLATLPALPPHLLRLHKPPQRLLLVDDEPNILAALKRLLRADHYQIHTANDGLQGLEVLSRQPVDVIVSDQRMPGMLGADFLRKARELAPDTIRIMLSGYTELQSVTDAVNEGAIYKFLTKPWDDEQLRAHIADAFRVKQSADDNERLHLEVRSANQELAAANRRMEQLLHEKQRQIHRDEISLNVAREVLQSLPLAVLGVDDDGMVAFVNGAAQALLGHRGPLLGEEAVQLLPGLGADTQPRHVAVIAGQRYTVQVYSMGAQSASRGSLVTLSATEEQP